MSDSAVIPLPGESFADWFERQRFRHFQADEFTSYFRTVRRGVANSEPPREMWKLIVPTLRIVDELRDWLDRPIVILSSYRSPAYNAPIEGAAKRSFHMRFQALDIAAAACPPREIFARLHDMRRRGAFRGGLGLYSTFVHIDTRGYDATWPT